jgi:hypothetical protein
MSKRSLPEKTKQQASLSSFFQPSKRTKVNLDSNEESNNNKYIIYCDLDGVLVDFEAGVQKLFPNHKESINDIPSKVLWPVLAKATGFYRSLPWMPDGKLLWKTILHISKVLSDKGDGAKLPCIQIRILTGCPMFNAAAHDKYQWCRRELKVETLHIPKTGPKNQQREPLKECYQKVQVITCRSKEKMLLSGKNWCVGDTDWMHFAIHSSS